MWWLNWKQVSYEYQAIVQGGRGRAGGQVLDFVVVNNGAQMAWRVNGTYWHTKPERKELDEVQRAALKKDGYRGVPIRYVVDLWDVHIMNPDIRERAFESALSGIELAQFAN